MSEMQKRELAFFGKITAGMTHEMKNVLAIINESSGLMEDLLAMASREPFPFQDRFLRATSSIQAQVQRGVDLSSRLNRFAHSIDEPKALVDLRLAVDHLALLSRRFANMKRVGIEVLSGDGEIFAEVSPIRLNMALFLACEFCWNRMPEGGILTVSAEKEGPEVMVALSCGDGDGPVGAIPDAPAALSEWRILVEAVETLPGRVSVHPSGSGLSVILPEAPRGELPG